MTSSDWTSINRNPQTSTARLSKSFLNVRMTERQIDPHI
jgi:hypothetical protein